MAPPDLEDAYNTLRLQAKRQKKNAKIIRVLVIFSICISLLILPCWSLYLLIGGIGPGLFEETPTYIYFVILGLVYGVFFIAPFLLCLPVIIPFALKQKNVGRIIVLRKFNDDVSKRALGYIIRSDLSNYGHVFTLSDKNFKSKWYVRIPVFLGQLSLFNFRQRTISKREDIARLEKKLSGKIWLNVNWLLSISKIFSIKTTDELWKDTAITLLKENRVIIFDISYETASLEWEFMEIKKLGYDKNIIAITNSEKLLSESKWKNIFDSQGELRIPVFYYDKKGQLPKKSEFDKTIVGILGSSFKNEDLHVSRTDFFKRTATTIGIVFFFFLFSLFFFSPYLLPDFVGKHSPFPRQVITAYIQSKVHSPVEDNYNQDIILRRIKHNWQKRASSILISYANDHYNAECNAVQSSIVEFINPENLDKYVELALHGEPSIADSALSIIFKINPRTLDKIALQLMASQRIDVKERSLKILGKIQLDSNLITGIINVIGKTSQPTTQKPAQHRGFLQLFNNSTLGVDLIITESNFYINLYNLLTHHKYLSDNLLQTSLNNQFLQPRIFSSMLLADDNNAAGITSLIDAALLKGKDRRYLIQFRPDTTYPYRKKADSLIASFGNAGKAPGIDTLKNLLTTRQFTNETSGTLINLAVFVIRTYTNADFDSFIRSLPDKNTDELRSALEYTIANDIRDIHPHLAQVIILSKPFLLKNKADQNIETRLKIAKLLAYTGDLSVVQTVREAAKIIKPSFLGKSTYPYYADIMDILKILYKNIQPPYDAKPFIEMKNNNIFIWEEMLNKFIAKARKK